MPLKLGAKMVGALAPPEPATIDPGGKVIRVDPTQVVDAPPNGNNGAGPRSPAAPTSNVTPAVAWIGARARSSRTATTRSRGPAL